jgi:hypothetical protein
MLKVYNLLVLKNNYLFIFFFLTKIVIGDSIHKGITCVPHII